LSPCRALRMSSKTARPLSELKDFCAYNTAHSSRNRVLDGIQVEKIPPE
jgi:hypothetical protein